MVLQELEGSSWGRVKRVDWEPGGDDARGLSRAAQGALGLGRESDHITRRMRKMREDSQSRKSPKAEVQGEVGSEWEQVAFGEQRQKEGWLQGSGRIHDSHVTKNRSRKLTLQRDEGMGTVCPDLAKQHWL